MNTNVWKLHSQLNRVDTVKQTHSHLRADILSARTNIYYHSDDRFFGNSVDPDELL